MSQPQTNCPNDAIYQQLRRTLKELEEQLFRQTVQIRELEQSNADLLKAIYATYTRVIAEFGARTETGQIKDGRF